MAQIILGTQKSFLGDIFGWWYSKGLRDFLIYLKAVFIKLSDIFSVRLLFKTFLSPWRRDVVPLEGMPFNEMLRAIAMNMVARLIGAFIKATIFLVYLVFLAAYIVISLVLLFVWIFLPIVSIAGIIFGIVLIISGD